MLATRADLGGFRDHVDSRFTVVDAKFDKLTWMLGVLIALAAANFAKQFF